MMMMTVKGINQKLNSPSMKIMIVKKVMARRTHFSQTRNQSNLRKKRIPKQVILIAEFLSV
jgi:hypothetical protein